MMMIFYIKRRKKEKLSHINPISEITFNAIQIVDKTKKIIVASYQQVHRSALKK